ncbi:bacillithiol system redox-active protein YtxJ [Saccharibacillus sp. CPCC 101409]|uniref:bacillithiol system redox-active protein YtxJ n=1 Tax=Saccharibacillus sp. CPCC 101409 TaxID=3058041 RepID=UPI0026731252|nr:bacillithiol system redox-active protein YtxJ [Saccharibacillus sp. CPCC 101409]MDO3409349.1 bacillithiol system redox-active protein YtxJ [Saccharibacillus sp. CPCC 101409]
MPNFTQIATSEQLDSAIQESEHKPVLVFKHSTRCPISARAYEEAKRYLQGTPNEEAGYVLIHVVEDRPVSLEAADRLGVEHASPQAILLKNGKAVWNTSHSRITSAALQEALS